MFYTITFTLSHVYSDLTRTIKAIFILNLFLLNLPRARKTSLIKQHSLDEKKMLLFLFIAISLLDATTPGYCTRAAGIHNTTDGGTQCIQDNLIYNMTNCCFICTRLGYLTTCGSLYNYNVTSCTVPSSGLTQATADCNGGSIFCDCFVGSNTSELYSTATAPPTNAPIGTNSGVQSNISMLALGIATFAIIVQFVM